ncbi:MAG: hypothetical protein AAGA61_08425, partial [Pseudomonadota bacterium]
MKRVFLILMFALAACADQGGAQSRQANVWLDEPVGRSSELPACPQRSKAWCTAVHIAGDSDNLVDAESSSSESSNNGDDDDAVVDTWMRALMRRGSTSS